MKYLILNMLPNFYLPSYIILAQFTINDVVNRTCEGAVAIHICLTVDVMLETEVFVSVTTQEISTAQCKILNRSKAVHYAYINSVLCILRLRKLHNYLFYKIHQSVSLVWL